MIIITNRKGENFEVLVDVEDFEKVKEYSWGVTYRPKINGYYVRSHKYVGMKNGKPQYKQTYLHRLVMNETRKIDIDHLNHNTLDNRKFNLKRKDRSKNMLNRSRGDLGNLNNKSGYRNVCWIESDQVWRVQLQINGRNTRLGDFKDVHEAGTFAKEMREKYYEEVDDKI